jgi:hypothetical protein
MKICIIFEISRKVVLKSELSKAKPTYTRICVPVHNPLGHVGFYAPAPA